MLWKQRFDYKASFSFTPGGRVCDFTRHFPSVLWIASIQDQEKQTQSELEDLSRNVALAFLQEMNLDIIGFEQSVKTVLETGQTPLRTFHTHQRMVLRFDRNMQMNAPFVEHNETKGADVCFIQPIRSVEPSLKQMIEHETTSNTKQ